MSERPRELALTLHALRVVTMKHRLRTLRSLRERRRTLSEVATLLALPKTSAHNHLKALEKDGFIAKTQNNGWVYYELTEIGRALAESDRVQVTLLLSTSAISLVSAAAVLGVRARLTSNSARLPPPSSPRPGDGWAVEPIGVGPVGTAPQTGVERIDLLLVAGCLALVGVAMAVMALRRRRRRPKQNATAGAAG